MMFPIKRSFNADLAFVRDAWTKAELIDRWWAPEGYRSTTKTIDFNPGGPRHYPMEGPDNFEMWAMTIYDEISHHQRFSGKECSADEHANISNELPLSDYHIRFYRKGKTKI